MRTAESARQAPPPAPPAYLESACCCRGFSRLEPASAEPVSAGSRPSHAFSRVQVSAPAPGVCSGGWHDQVCEAWS
ncbi:Hypothetical predicted protein [Marmota monax]|uniref:Uncharacterized protein n=1 Tax=Marmota monax TaxID=9995 RepID=A0A5E4BE76_MARMO|nr:Hypothetical predicted protein [Marmota monax]